MNVLNSLFYKRKWNIFLCIYICIFLLLYINVSFGQDEDFTMMLVHHSYSNLLCLNSMDVHPPLYYLVLKLFLQISTFWTKSIFVKIIFARFLSLIFAIITFLILSSISSILGYNIRKKDTIFLFFLIPTVILYSTQIRMYSLAAMGLSVELFNLIKFDKTYKKRYLFLAFIFAEITAYSHYFGLISAGIFIILFLIKYIYEKKIRIFIHFIFCSIIFISLYIPQIIVIKEQMSSSVSNASDNKAFLIREGFDSFIGSPFKVMHKLFILPFVLFLIILIYLTIYLLKFMNSDFKIILMMSFLNLIITVFIGESASLYMSDSFYNHRYSYPIFIIVSFFIIILILRNNKYCNKEIILCLMAILFLINTVSVVQGFNQYKRSFTYIYNIEKFDKNKIYIRSSKKSNARLTCYSSYMPNKKIVTNYVDSSLTFGHKNSILFKKLYYNVRSKNIK